MVLTTAKPPMASSSKGRRRQLCVAVVSGMAATNEPTAYIVTNWPMSDCETPRSALMRGSSPAGSASVRMVMKAAVASASRPEIGRRSEVVVAVMSVMNSPASMEGVARTLEVVISRKNKLEFRS